MSWLTKEFLNNEQSKSKTSPLGPFAPIVNQATNLPRQPLDLQSMFREQLAAQGNHMQMLLAAMNQPNGIRRLGIDGRPENPNRLSGLAGFYQDNPHLAKDPKNPTSAADFNKRVYGESGRWGGMDKQTYTPGDSPWADVVKGQQMLQEERNRQNPMSKFGTGSVIDTGKKAPGGGMVNVNGVITPLASFLLGANRAQQKGLSSDSYQTQLTPEEKRKMYENPKFGKA